ncbi:diguanylate cyclase [uncultured Tyzzerella sp.]|uniref:diguanylate cyclase domain-containing protein n=1 Tax=uncultured Tyzzerella sp. TaxID=2321398 RepID=UPI0029435186|nr:diguanylate cyclase [uncultured Tyzzerella sp.]
MKKKDSLSIKILLSTIISLVLILICFYRYSKATNYDYIQRSKEEAFDYGYLNSQLFESRIKNIIGKLGYIRNLYFVGVDIVDENIKDKFNSIISTIPMKINIYTKTEFENMKKKYRDILNPSKKNKDILYLYNQGENYDQMEVVLPIYFNGETIGAISSYIREKEINSFYKEEHKENKFITYIINFNGDIVFGGEFFNKKNIYEIIETVEIEEYPVNKEIYTENIKRGKSFEIYFINNDKGYYAFFNPTDDNFYTLEIMPEDYVKKDTREKGKLLIFVLIKVITIILIQVIFLFMIIINQNKKFIKKEIIKNRELNSIINSVPGGVIKIICDKDLKILFANEGFYDLTGYSKYEYTQNFDNKLIDIIEKQDRQYILDKIKEAKKLKGKLNIECKIIKKDNIKNCISLTGEYLEDFNGIPIYQCIAIDINEYKKILSDLELEKEQYDIIFNISNEIIFEYYIDGDILDISERYKETFNVDFEKQGFIKNIIKTRSIHKDDLRKFIESIKNINEYNGSFSEEIRIKNKEGSYNWALYQGFIINDSDGNTHKIVGKITNIDKFKKEIEELKEKSIRDPLTKVYNKVAIENIVNEAIKKDPKNSHVLFIIDIDDFKGINDTFGHIFGDAVLKSISSSIKKICAEQEFVARIGGDEFVLFLQKVDNFEYIINMAENVCNVFRKTYEIKNIGHKISASVGISIYPQDGNNYTEILEKADIAVYHAKNEGKDQYKIYNEQMKNISLLDKQKDDNKEDEIRNLKRKSVYENVLINISEMFLQVKDIKVTINLILATLCKSYNISRAYVFEVSENDKFISNTYEWCDDNVKPLKDKMQNIKFDEKEYLKAYKQEAFLYYNSKESIQENEDILKYIYEKDNINIYFSCYFMEQGKVKGFMGFEGYNSYEWHNEEIEGVFFIARLIGTQITKDKIDKKFHTELQINNAIINNEQLYTYIIKEDTFELLYFNEKMESIMPEVKTGQVCYKVKGYDKRCHYCPIRDNIEYIGNNSTNYFCEIANMWLGASYSKIKWMDGTDAYIVCARDISEYIEQINYIDSLTGVPSITKFKIQANNILSNTKSDEQKYALLYMDIDKFKYINNTFGYGRGDDVLKNFATILYDVIEDDEIFCRANDDIFLAIIKYKSEDELKQRIKSANKKINKMQKLLFNDMRLTIICGVYKINPKDKDLNSMIDRANIARKHVKGSHKNSFAIYTKEMNENIVKEKLIEDRMSYAMENEEFLVYLQPKFNLNTNEVCGAEALVRWEQKNGEMVLPSDFIPIFEKNGFIVNLDFYIYEKTFKKIRQWLDNGLKVMPISLNVSRVHTISFEFVKNVLNLVNKYNIPVELVEFELTENIFSTDFNYLNSFIQELRKNGLKVSIDDFGSAYSSLNLLKEIDVDIIKLDKGFLSTQENINNKDRIVIEYIVKMAKELNLNVVCEGVETLEQVEILREIGCKVGQGYVFSKPIPIEQFEKIFLKN